MAKSQLKNAKSKIKKRMVGHNVSHSNVKTKRTFGINSFSKKVKLENGNNIKVRLTSRILRTWRKHGSTIEVLENIIANGDK